MRSCDNSLPEPSTSRMAARMRGREVMRPMSRNRANQPGQRGARKGPKERRGEGPGSQRSRSRV